MINAPPPFLLMYTGSIGVAIKCPDGSLACEADTFNAELLLFTALLLLVRDEPLDFLFFF